MIQRIQSIFLLLAAACAFGLFALPFAEVAEPTVNTVSPIFEDGVFDIKDQIGTMILFCLAGALTFGSIFLFNNRGLQMRLSRFAIIANIIGLVLAIVMFFNNKDLIGTQSPEDGLGIYLPILFIVFALLALRFIGKDDKLVNSMDRLR